MLSDLSGTRKGPGSRLVWVLSGRLRAQPFDGFCSVEPLWSGRVDVGPTGAASRDLHCCRSLRPYLHSVIKPCRKRQTWFG